MSQVIATATNSIPTSTLAHNSRSASPAVFATGNILKAALTNPEEVSNITSDSVGSNTA